MLCRGNLRLNSTETGGIGVKTVYALLAIMLVFSCTASTLGETLVWECDDPLGDDNGPGGYVYPTNPAFAPFKGHFDLTKFRVMRDDKSVHFDVSLAELTNTWNAPEGFSHQLIEVYIDNIPGAGRLDTVLPGANVRFDRRYAWDMCIRMLAWGGSRITVGDQEHHIWAGVLPNTSTIRASVPIDIVGEPADSWHYYVTVSSQDGYGPDNHRPVTSSGGAWVFAGGSDSGLCPYVIDILASASGNGSQQAQLGSWSDSERRMATLVPASVEAPAVTWAPIAGWVAALIAVIGGSMGMVAYRRRVRGRKES